ncbi:MAG TPA: tripartite tricarboxylate transporter substrate binding protein [Ramlibacter sp.]|jgi:tripartite-type tricarboxylate transporter receptor subunit TctC
MLNRRQLLASLAAGPLVGGRALAQAAFPTKPVRLIVGYTAGGAVDLIARALAQQMQSTLGQPVIVENRPGAGTNVAIRALTDAAPDGHTLMLAANALAANVSLYQPAPYDLGRDITPVSLVGRVPVVLAVASGSPIKTLQQFVAASKAGSMNYGSPGNGSTPHLAMELFERTAGVKLTHVPYKGGSQAITDVLGGHLQAVAVNALEVQPHVNADKLRVLGVMTLKRSGIFPDVPTVAEAGFPNFEAAVWYGVVGPASMAPALVARLHGDVQKALATEDVRRRLTSAGGEVLPGPTAQLTSLLQSESARYGRLIREAQIKPD